MERNRKINFYRMVDIVSNDYHRLYVSDFDGRTIFLTKYIRLAKKYDDLEFDKLLENTNYERYQFRIVEETENE